MTDSPEDRSARQFSLRLEGPSLGFEDLDVTACNRSALTAVRRWRDWRGPAMCLVGPPKSGVSTLLRAWASDASGLYLSPGDIADMDLAALERLAQRPIALDDAESCDCDDPLLSIFNFVAAANTRLLMGARRPPAGWSVQSKDLKSRLAATPVAGIDPPDEAMIAARLRSSARRRYLRLSDETVDYLCIRVGRSYSVIESFMSRLDAAVQRHARQPTIALAREALDEVLGESGENDEIG